MVLRPGGGGGSWRHRRRRSVLVVPIGVALGLGLRGSYYETEASSPELEPVLDPNGDRHVRSVGFGGGFTGGSGYGTKRDGFTINFALS